MKLTAPLTWLFKTLRENFNAPPHNDSPKFNWKETLGPRDGYAKLHHELKYGPKQE